MISVVIPLYNKAAQIERTLKSVLAQTYGDYEVVVVDDGSTDGSADVVRRIADLRIRVVSQANAGVAAARNRGIAEARGEFVALLDGDDEWMPEYLETQASLAAKYAECDVFATDYVLKSMDGSVKNTVINGLRFDGEDGELSNYFEVAASSNPPVCSISIMARRGVFESVGGFPAGIRSGEDLLTWARLACRYRMAYSRRALAVFNVEGYDTHERPKRIPAEVDVVGRELDRLLDTYNPPYMRRYISLWHKMRSSIYMRLRMRRRSVAEAVKGLRYSPSNYKLYAFIVLNLLPKRIQPF